MTKIDQKSRELLAQIQEEEKAAREAMEKLVQENAVKKAALLAKLRAEDLEDVKEKCLMHGFSVAELKGVLKKRANSGMPRKTTRKKKEQVTSEQESPKS